MSKINKNETAPELHDFVVEFRKYKTELTKKFKERKPWKPKDDSKMLSYIPGTITDVFVKEGQHILPGDKMMILEAMKMKNTIFAEYAATILKINVKEGDQVPKSTVIFELELDRD